MKVVNLTPHTLNIFDENNEQVLEIKPSGTLARISTKKEKVGVILGFPVFKTVPGELIGLPLQVKGVIYVVSGIVRSYTSGRDDVFQPGELIRNEKGQPIGCVGLSQ